MHSPSNAPRADDSASRLLALLAAMVDELQPGRAARRALSLDASLERDLGIDSLARVEMGLRVEAAFGVRLPDGVVAAVETPRALLEAIAQAAPGRAVAPPPAMPLAADDVAGEPDDAQTLLDVLAWHVARHPARTLVTFLDGDERVEAMSYAALDQRARRVAAGLQAEGVAPGRAVAIMLPSSLEFFAAFVGVLMAGGVPVPIYPPFRMSTLEDHMRRQAGILANCEAVALVTVPEARLLARLLRGEVASLKSVATVSDLERATAQPGPVITVANDVAFLQYTSGSTGDPKGVVLTHAQLLANMRAMGHATGATPADVFVSWLPLYHDMGLIGAWMCSLYFGLHLVLMSPVAFLSRPVRWLHAIHRYRGTISAAPNFAYDLVASRLPDADVEGIDLSSWRWAFNGAEPVSPDTLDRFAQRFASHGFDRRALAPVYGLAECGLDLAFPATRRGPLVDTIDRDALADDGRAVVVPASHSAATRVVACGQALPGYTIRIVDGAGRALDDRRIGRVEFKGPSATTGYHRNPAANAKLFDDGWIDTGDLGYLVEGELFLTGRSKDMIIRAGHNIHPYELEDAVGALPGVRRGCVAVFAERNAAQTTDRLVVVAETRETDPAKRAAIERAIDDLAVRYADGPADEVVLAPPHTVRKTSSGKIRRAATREAIRSGQGTTEARAVWLQVTRLALHGAWRRLARWNAGFRAGLWGAWAALSFAGICVAGLVATFVPGLGRRRRITRRIARVLLGLLRIRLDVKGVQALPRGPMVIVANHASYLDAIVLAAALPVEFAFIAKAEFRANPVARHVFGAAGTRFVERFDAQQGITDTRALASAVHAGESLALFPEGTFRARPGLLAFRLGAFAIAAEAGAPIVPVALAGARALLPFPSFRPRRGVVTVTITPPLVAQSADFGAAVRLRNEARASILAHCGEPDSLGAS